jgi:hypothetical protein
MNDNKILEALEQFGALYPWDKVGLWVDREPEGKISFTACIYSDHQRGLNNALASGESIEEAVRRCRAEAGERDPEMARERALRDIRERLVKLQAIQFGPPPYRAGSLLAAGALNLPLDVKESPPF